MSECLRCAPRSADVGHYRLHLGLRALVWQCADCQLPTPDVRFALTHALLFGHSVSSIWKVPFLPDEAQLATFFAAARSTPTAQNLTATPETKQEPILEEEIAIRKNALLQASFSTDRTDDIVPKRNRKRSETSTVTKRNDTAFDDFVLKPPRPEDRIGVGLEEDSAEDGVSLNCSRCSYTRKPVRKHVVHLAVSHVTACLQVKPYSCSECLATYARRAHAQNHILRYCPAGSIVLKRKDEDEAAIRLGLQACYPNLTGYTWRGLR